MDEVIAQNLQGIYKRLQALEGSNRLVKRLEASYRKMLSRLDALEARGTVTGATFGPGDVIKVKVTKELKRLACGRCGSQFYRGDNINMHDNGSYYCALCDDCEARR